MQSQDLDLVSAMEFTSSSSQVAIVQCGQEHRGGVAAFHDRRRGRV